MGKCNEKILIISIEYRLSDRIFAKMDNMGGAGVLRKYEERSLLSAFCREKKILMYSAV